MGFWTLLLHLVEFATPAVGAALPLAVGVSIRFQGWWPLLAWRRFWLAWGWLTVAGLLALVAGLWWWGRDGKMATYAAMVVAMGTLGWWLRRLAVPGVAPGLKAGGSGRSNSR